MEHTSEFSLYEEIANSITHGVGLLLATAGMVVLVVLAALKGDAWHIVSCSVYGSTLVFMYAASTVYHSVQHPRWKHALRIIDHSAIYLLIAGTYTPFTLVNMRGGWGWSLFGVAWGLCLFGIVWKALFIRRFQIIGVLTYVAMGWMVIVATKPLFERVPAGGIALLLAGGVAYTAGLFFFAHKRIPHHHAIWHVFVMIGSVCHYVAVLLYVLPRAA